MAKFSKGQYVVLMKALSKAYSEAPGYGWHGRDQDHVREGVKLAAADICGELSKDNPSFSPKHFMEVVKGEKPLDSSPFEDLPGWWPKGKPNQSHK